jgi:LuxR family quorum sensing-dependent transcriptional regulator
MSRTSLDSTLEMIAFLDGAQSVEELRCRLVKQTKSFGVERILAGVLPGQDATTTEQAEAIILADWPMEWLNRYVERGYIEIDPVTNIINTKNRHVVWSEAHNLVKIDRQSQSVLYEAIEFKLVNGLTIPIQTAEGKHGFFSFSGQNPDIKEVAAGVIPLIAHFAFAKSLQLKGVATIARTLAPRQLDVIRWAAEGKTDWEIGMILNISEHTVDKYMRQIKERLGANNRCQVIATAIRLRLID